MKAVWNGEVIAESEDTIVLGGFHYFPPDSIRRQFFRESDTETLNPSRGIATYLTLHVNGKENPDSAWFFSEPTALIRDLKNFIAFWRGVEVMT